MGEWRTIRNPPAPIECRQALSALIALAAADARQGHWKRAQDAKRAIDVLSDFVSFEPKAVSDSGGPSDG